jgi:cyclin A
MRSILVDWLVEVSEEYKLNGETLSLAINYIDRFLSFMSVVRAKLQLVGTAAILIAAKYEEIYPPEIGEFVYITDDTYTKVQVLRMEKLLLKVLSFDLSGPTHFSFTNLFCIMLDYPDQIKYMAQYLCELSMLNAQPYLEYKPSEISVASISLSLYTFKQKLWNHKLTGITGYTLEELKEIIVYLNDVHNQASTLQQQAIQEKFKSSKYLQTSLVTPKRLTIEMIDEILGSEGLDELNTTAENIETVRQKTSSLLF